MTLFLVATADPAFAASAEADARAQLARQGIGPVTAFDLDGWRLLHARPVFGGPDTLLDRGDDLVAVAGMPMVDGLIGRAALERLLAPGPVPDPAWRRLGGQFVAVVRKGGRTFLFTDPLAGFQCFHDRAERLFSTAMLPAVAALPSVSFDPQGLYEWALHDEIKSPDTIFAELKLMGPERVVDLTPHGAVSHPLKLPVFPTEPVSASFAEHIVANRDRLMAAAGALVGAFGDAIACPLSGGYDSRLLLASLRAAGARPHVYVYGGAGDVDVRLARAMGAAEGFDVEWTDKQAAPIASDAFVAQVERSFLDNDGLPTCGNIFDNGRNAVARDARHAGGMVAVSGVAGEIYRDYFLLPDRPVSTLTVMRCRHRFAPTDMTGRFDPARHLARIADKAAALVDSDHRAAPLPRLVAEQAFIRTKMPMFIRWEATSEARFGPYYQLYADPGVIEEAARVPLADRRAGRFNAALIAAIDPGLARHPSAYDFAFADGPGWRHRLDQRAQRLRPMWLRERGYRLRRLRPMGDEHGGLLSPDYLGRVIDLGYPAMRRFFRIERINDAALLRRVSCLEYLAERLGGKLAA